MKVIDTYNAIVGAAVAVLSYIFGEHWILFALFLAFNVADWITGWMKARLTHKENSKAGWKGVLKKLAYWIMIAVAFGTSTPISTRFSQIDLISYTSRDARTKKPSNVVIPRSTPSVFPISTNTADAPKATAIMIQ